MDPYAVLRVARDASTEQIRKQYMALALQLHPDKADAAGEATPGTAEGPAVGGGTTAFQQLQSAWEVLRDDGKRRTFDENAQLADARMVAHVAEVDLEDMDYDESDESYCWPCRCSDSFIVAEVRAHTPPRRSPSICMCNLGGAARHDAICIPAGSVGGGI
jgi:diphthamide biosynthesis protein 4